MATTVAPLTMPAPSPGTLTMPFELTQLSPYVFCVTEMDPWGYNPLIYIIVGEEKVLIVDTGCDYGNLYFFVKSIPFVAERRILVVNTHNHAEQVDELYASGAHKYYTRLLNSSQHWQVKMYKVTTWLNDGDHIYLGNKDNPRNLVEVHWTPGHTPDHMIIHYPMDNRLFVGDFFCRFGDILLTYEYTDLQEFEKSLTKVLHIASRMPPGARYSSAKADKDHCCVPTFKHFQRFFYAVTAGTHPGTELRIDDAEGWRYETRDRAMRIVLSRELVRQLEEARTDSEARQARSPSIGQ